MSTEVVNVLFEEKQSIGKTDLDRLVEHRAKYRNLKTKIHKCIESIPDEYRFFKEESRY